MRTTIQRKSNTNVKNVMKFSCNVVKENYTWRQFIWKIYTTAYNVRKHFHIKMNMWWLIIWSFNIVLHYYHKYVKAGVSPVSNSKCASGNRALEKFPRFRKVSFSKVLFGNFSGNVWKFPRNCACGYFFSSRKFPKKCASRYVLPTPLLMHIWFHDGKF